MSGRKRVHTRRPITSRLWGVVRRRLGFEATVTDNLLHTVIALLRRIEVARRRTIEPFRDAVERLVYSYINSTCRQLNTSLNRTLWKCCINEGKICFKSGGLESLHSLLGTRQVTNYVDVTRLKFNFELTVQTWPVATKIIRSQWRRICVKIIHITDFQEDENNVG